MLKIVVSVAVILAYLCLDGEAAAVGANQIDGGNYNNVQNLDPCTEVTCDTDSCRAQCENMGFDRGYCKYDIVKCSNNISAKKKQCTCVGEASEESSEAANAGEGSSSNATNSDTNNSDSSDSSTKKSRNPKRTSISPAANTTTRAVPNAAGVPANSAGASTASSGVTASASKATTTPQTSQ